MAQNARSKNLSRWILLPFAVVAFVTLAFLARNFAVRELASPSKATGPSPSPWAAPFPSPSPSPQYATCQPWSRCPASDWLKARLANAGISIVGETGAALTVEVDGLKLHVGAPRKRELSDSGFRLVGEVANTPVFGDGTRLTWVAYEYRLWVENARAGPLPSVEQIKDLVKATLDD